MARIPRSAGGYGGVRGSLALPAAGTLVVLLVAALGVAAPRAAAAVQDGKLAYASDEYQPGAGLNVYTINADGTGKTRLVSSAIGPTDGYPTWFPSGDRLVYYSFRDGDAGRPEIYTMNADASAQVRTVSRLGMRDEAPAVSPDGQRIAFASDQFGGAGSYDIFVMNADGTGVTRLTTSAQSERNPDWSPNGSRIAYSRDDGNDWEIFVMNADGTGQTALTAANADEDSPSWSPDGTRIAFDLGNGNRNIWVMDADGTDRQNLTNSDGTLDRRDPAWSPAGRRIAFTSKPAAGDYDIQVMSSDGTGISSLTDNAVNDVGPNWQKLIVPDPPAPAADPGAAPPLPQVVDSTAPSISVRGRRLTRRRPLVKGGVGDASGVSEVAVAIRVRQGRRCRWVRGDKLRRAGCNSPRYMNARLTGDRWSYRVTRPVLRKLRRRAAAVRIYARAIDLSGNVSDPARKRLRLARRAGR